MDGLPKMTARLAAMLDAQGLTIEQCAAMSETDLLAIPNFGRTTLKELQTIWAARGLKPLDLHQEIGQRLSQVRTIAAMDQKEMASALGMELKHYRRIERGLAKLQIEALRDISTCFNVSTDWLVLGIESEKIERTNDKLSE